MSLTNLESLILNFDVICTEKKDPTEWFADFVSILPSLESLRTLQIDAAFEGESFGKEKQRLADELLCLSRLKNVVVELSDSDHKEFNMNQIMKEINERQARKNDYLFY